MSLNIQTACIQSLNSKDCSLKTLFTLFSIFIITVAIAPSALAQNRSSDVLLVSVGESSGLYADVATHLQGLFAGVSGFENAQVVIVQDPRIESLSDGFYDQNPEDIAFRAKVTEGYRNVILIPTIYTTPTGTIEFREFGGGPTNVYDDLPFDNKYFAPEVFYEGATQLSKQILNTGSTPQIFLPNNVDQNVNEFGSVMQRVANGVGLNLIPGAQAVQSAGTISNAEEQYLYACSIFTQVTELNANDSTYSPAGIASNKATSLGNVAEATINTHRATEYYNTSYELDGAVVYRNLDLSSAPFNDVVKYAYKGTSTHDFTRDALQKIIGDNPETSSFFRKLGTRNGESFGTRYWHPDDIDSNDGQNQLARLTNANDTDQRSFMYVSGSFAGADAQTLINLNQENLVPLAFDWIKSFAIDRLTGTASTLDALDFHSASELYFNYAERGWNLIPLTIGMGRLNEAMENFVASDDGIHISDPLVYMNAYMMLSSALGTEFPFPEITADDIRRGNYTSEQIRMAALIGHQLIKEHAYLAETGDFVPDSNLLISTNELPNAPIQGNYSFQLSATGGDGNYSWELISDAGLPDGLSLSNNGLLSGTAAAEFGTLNTAFQVTDGTGAFKKVGLKLSSATEFVADVEVNLGESQRSSVELITILFDGEVMLADGAIAVVQRSTQTEETFEPVETIVSQVFANGQTTATIEFESHVRNASNALVDGNYQLTLTGSLITRDGVPMSGDFVFGDNEDDRFFSFYGDSDGNRTCNIFDLLPFRRTYRATSGSTNYQYTLDFDANGVVNIFDLLPFRRRYRTSMPFEF